MVLVDYDIIIVGAGASGLMAAIAAARQNTKVLVIEQKEKAGKKLLATGNGKCNYTNLVQIPSCYRSEDPAFIGRVLPRFPVPQTIAFFESLGIYPRERNGYLYPNSEQAVSVLDVLLFECRRLRVQFAFEEKVIAIKEPDFTVVTQYRISQKNSGNTPDKKVYYGKKLILATGGCASSKLGSDGSGYPFAKQFGHTVIKPLPALVALKSPARYCKTLAGVRTAARVTACTGRGENPGEIIVAQEQGEIIFTDYGISGIPVMQLSRYVAKLLDRGESVCLKIDFFTERTVEEVNELLHKRIKNSRGKTLEEMMVGLFNSKLSYILIKEAKLMPQKNVTQLSVRDVRALSLQIKQFYMQINDTNAFENAQVCAGGVATKEIDEKTMESKKRKNLFFSGELLDVDGTCGGYNLQWAWSSGYLAGTAAGAGHMNQVE
jgi:predicted Rossmann fold flavoprotein